MTNDNGKCDCCDGSGRHPVADYLRSSKGDYVPCGACNGTGNYVWRLPAEAKKRIQKGEGVYGKHSTLYLQYSGSR